MAKISQLAEVAAPTGAETVVVLDGAIAKRVRLKALTDAAVAPAVASVAQVATDVAVTASRVRGVAISGLPPLASDGAAFLANWTMVDARPVRATGRGKVFTVFAPAAGDYLLFFATLTFPAGYPATGAPNGTVAPGYSRVYTLAAGWNAVDITGWSPALVTGLHYPGVQGVGGTAPGYHVLPFQVGAPRPLQHYSFYTASGGIGTDTGLANGEANELLAGVEIEVAAPTGSMVRQLAALAANVLVYGADPSGAQDSTAAFENARAGGDFVFVPAGTYTITTWTPGRFWGPGAVLLRGQRQHLPAHPRELSFARAMRARWPRVGTVALLADSIGEFYNSTVERNHWWDKLRQSIAGDVDPRSRPHLTNFSSNGYATATGPSFYGFAKSGSTALGANGPIERALIMQPGSSLTFVGYHDLLGLTYDRAPGAGTITITRNGQQIGTLDTSGAAEPDRVMLPLATGGTAASDSYALAVSGGPLTLTGLSRLGSQSARAPRFMRFASFGQTVGYFTNAARLASILKQSRYSYAATPAVPLFVEALGTNNVLGTTPAQLQADLETLYAALLGAGAYVVSIGLYRFDFAARPVFGGNAFEDYAAAKAAAAEKYRVPVIELDSLDLVGRGLLYDGLHPHDVGFELYYRAVADALASGSVNVAAQRAA